MTKTSPAKWDKVNVPKAMTDLIEQYLETDLAKQRGLKNKSDAATEGLKMLLERDGMYKRRPRFDILNHYDNTVKIIDNQENRIATIYFNNGKTTCDVCCSQNCVHTDYVKQLPEVKQKLEENN